MLFPPSIVRKHSRLKPIIILIHFIIGIEAIIGNFSANSIQKHRMRGVIMKQLWAAIALSFLLLAGCSSNAANNKEAIDGETLYKQKCAACHGENLKGVVGPPVLNMGSKYTEKELLNLINQGSQQMPGNLLTDEEAKVVTNWLLEK